MRVPGATYRLQLGPDLSFDAARALVPYLDSLGVTDLYLSPILAAAPGSPHGYDQIDPTRVNPELGGEAAFEALAGAARERGMGVIVDVVPNHMCISDRGNRWWMEVLEDGPASPYASFFDIDWRPPKPELWNKVLLPILGDSYGRALEEGHIRLAREGGAFFAIVYDRPLPLDPRSTSAILDPVIGALREGGEDRLELESIRTALDHLPRRGDTGAESVRERAREKEIVKRRLAALLERSEAARVALDETIARLNGRKGEPASFDGLDAILSDQAWRVSFWRVASDEINYRRFFDVNSLAAISVERPEVFARVHEVVLGYVRRGLVTGLRIDHVDGLYDPLEYLRTLVAACRAEGSEVEGDERPPIYIVVEKILEIGATQPARPEETARPKRTDGDTAPPHAERLHAAWPVAGTTGYDFLNEANALFVDPTSRPAFNSIYAHFAGRVPRYRDVLGTSKKLIMNASMAGEMHVLTLRLDRISEQHRWSRDFTRESFRHALREVIAAFPVYRTYTRAAEPVSHPDDRAHTIAAIAEAKRRNRVTAAALFDFVGSVLLLEHPDGLSAGARAARRELVMRFQQITGPVMAKGAEDTAFYRYFPLASLCEVGGDPTAFGASLEAFHESCRARLAGSPHGLNATTTHDTKRSEDARARLDVLSEIPRAWGAAIRRWREIARAHKATLPDGPAPDANDEYLLYQTIIAAYPLDPAEVEGFRERVKAYMLKATREAKTHTSWFEQHAAYEEAVAALVDALLDPGVGSEFLTDLRAFLEPVALLGAVNGLAQMLVKVAAPGVPDFFQGTEFWTLTLVDPDNRGAVDFEKRRAMLEAINGRARADRGALIRDLLSGWQDGAVKLYATAAALRFRREHRALFEEGEHVALDATGARARSVIAFARRGVGSAVLVVAPRLLAGALAERGGGAGMDAVLGDALWADTRVGLRPGLPARWRDVFTGEVVEAAGPARELALAAILRRFPIAMLAAEDEPPG